MIDADVGLGIVAEVKLVAIRLFQFIDFLEALVRRIQADLFVFIFSKVGH